ncbi:CU044_2847 family protein [Streptomyces sp. NPDC003247]|uniref:CU044_2847 family protein n=1 Tax=Streptomyces sp. NPDC003247 TaxID=3364677 RepID=UPI003693C5A1
MVRGAVRVPLPDGGQVLFEAPDESGAGPVKAGRLSDAVRDFPGTLHQALTPAVELARTTLQQLRQDDTSEVQIEFGLDLTSELGAVVAKGGVGAHLKVTVTWSRDGSQEPGS